MQDRTPKSNPYKPQHPTPIVNETQAGLSDEERREIDAAISPGVVAAAAAAAAPAPAARVEQDAAEIGGNDKGGTVDVGRLLDLCGLAPSPPKPRAAAPKVHPRGAECHTDELADCSPRADLDVASEEDGADEGYNSSFRGEERDVDWGRRSDNPEGDAADIGVGAGGGGEVRANGRATEAAAVAVDEHALRRVTHQADLYGRLLVRTVGGPLLTNIHTTGTEFSAKAQPPLPQVSRLRTFGRSKSYVRVASSA